MSIRFFVCPDCRRANHVDDWNRETKRKYPDNTVTLPHNYNPLISSEDAPAVVCPNPACDCIPLINEVYPIV